MSFKRLHGCYKVKRYFFKLLETVNSAFLFAFSGVHFTLALCQLGVGLRIG